MNEDIIEAIKRQDNSYFQREKTYLNLRISLKQPLEKLLQEIEDSITQHDNDAVSVSAALKTISRWKKRLEELNQP